MPYRSRFNGVLLVRKLHEEEAYREWMLATDRLAVEREHMRRLKMKFEATLEDMAGRQNQMVAEEMALYFRFMQNLREEMIRQESVVLRQEAVCEERRVVLERAVKERKGVEQVEEKRKAVYQESLSKKEQGILDEIGGRVGQGER